MRILRFLVLLLLVVNLVLFAAGGGLFGRSGSGEPERLTNQIDPEKIRILHIGPPASVPAAVPPAAAAQPVPGPRPEAKPESPVAAGAVTVTCRRFPSLARDRASRIADVARARTVPVETVQKSLEEPISYWVYVPPQSSRQELDSRIEELKAAGVTDYFIEQKAGANHLAVSLGLFKTERMALDLRDKLRAKGISGARVAARENPTGRVSLELRGASAEIDAVLAEAGPALDGLEAQPCAPGQ